MTDIVERLRDEAIEPYCYYSETMELAAAEIERLRRACDEAYAEGIRFTELALRAEIERLRSELEIVE